VPGSSPLNIRDVPNLSRSDWLFSQSKRGRVPAILNERHRMFTDSSALLGPR